MGPDLPRARLHALCLAAFAALLPAAGAQGPSSPIAVSSTHSPDYAPEFAVDGNPASRWASGAHGGGAAWYRIDLGESVPIGSVTVRWEAAYAAEWSIAVSDDGENWTTVAERKDGQGGVETLDALGVAGRCIRLDCLRPGPFGLYSLWEIEVAAPDGRDLVAAIRRRMEEAREAIREEARKGFEEALAGSGAEEIVFAVRAPGIDGHWYANFGYYAGSTEDLPYRIRGGGLYRLNVRTGETTTILEDPDGCVRDPQVHYDGDRILFAYLKGGTRQYHLYEVRKDGTGLRQLTDGDCDDIEPTYLPDGGVAFCSSRSNRWVNCWLTPVATLYRCDADGANVRPLSANVEHDNTPWPLPDGRLLYMRWEYVDRSQVDYHHLWTMNPDGAGQMVYYGNMHPGTVMLGAKPIPGSREVVCIFSPGHGITEHQGYLTRVDPGNGPDDQARATRLAAPGDLRDPYPVNSEHFLVARGAEIQGVGPAGEPFRVYRLPQEAIARELWCHEPSLLIPRARETRIPVRPLTSQSTGRLVLTNVYEGRNMAGVEPGSIKKLLVLESLPKPINYTGGMDPISYGGTFTLERVVGTAPVEEDGSAYLELPALRSLFLVALDENDLSVKRMHSFLTLQPGESQSCLGCHEPRTTTTQPPSSLLATRRAPSVPERPAGVPEVFDFPRDIQPILDAHCLLCHDYEAHAGGLGPMAGGVILSGDRGPMFSHSYYTLTYKRQVADGRNEPVGNRAPRTTGTSASPLMRKLLERHHEVSPSPRELDMVRYWIESGATYPGTYGALGGGSIGGYYANTLTEVDAGWPETIEAADAIARRCAECHTGDRVLPRALSDERDVSFWRPDWNDPRLRFARHRLFNLTRPERSLMLLAPLSRDAGGFGLCTNADGGPVFVDTEDPDYGRILAMCAAGKSRLEEIKRFDMSGFRPPEPYLREMLRYGVLKEAPPEDAAVDTYALDAAYWESLWWTPEATQ